MSVVGGQPKIYPVILNNFNFQSLIITSTLIYRPQTTGCQLSFLKSSTAFSHFLNSFTTHASCYVLHVMFCMLCFACYVLLHVMFCMLCFASCYVLHVMFCMTAYAIIRM